MIEETPIDGDGVVTIEIDADRCMLIDLVARSLDVSREAFIIDAALKAARQTLESSPTSK